MNKKNIIAITGPTATGKSELGFYIAKKLNTQIISVDSKLVYRNFEIAAAKPDKETLSEVQHHLINFVDPHMQYTAGDFVFHARQIIENLHNQGKIPVFVGGTYLYYKVLLEDYDLPLCKINYEYRDYLDKKSDMQLYDILLKADFDAAQKIHSNNRVKIIRALELIKFYNKKLKDIMKEREYEAKNNVIWFGLNSNNRKFLYDRINKRVDRMMEAGLLQETIENYNRYEELDTFRNTIGYCELIDYLHKNTSLDEAVEKIKQHTRNYAKRQISFMKPNQDITWYDIEEMDINSIFEEAYKIVTNECN